MKEKVKDASRLIRKMGDKKTRKSALSEVSMINAQLHRGISHPDLSTDFFENSTKQKGLRRNISEVNVAEPGSGRRVSYEGHQKSKFLISLAKYYFAQIVSPNVRIRTSNDHFWGNF